MPTYVYKCDECGITFERFQHFSEEPVRTCPECNGLVFRIIQPVGVIFKGSGFYVTDNKGSASSMMPKTDSKPHEGKSEGEEAKAGDTAAADSPSGDET